MYICSLCSSPSRQFSDCLGKDLGQCLENSNIALYAIAYIPPMTLVYTMYHSICQARPLAFSPHMNNKYIKKTPYILNLIRKCFYFKQAVYHIARLPATAQSITWIAVRNACSQQHGQGRLLLAAAPFFICTVHFTVN